MVRGRSGVSAPERSRFFSSHSPLVSEPRLGGIPIPYLMMYIVIRFTGVSIRNTEMKRKMKKATRSKSPGRPRIYKDVAEVLAVRLPKSLLKEVDAYAKAEGIRGRSALIRIMIEEGLERRKPGRRG